MFLLFLALVFLLLYFIYQDCRRPPNYPPGPVWIPIIGNLHTILKSVSNSKFLHLALTDLAEKYGPVLGLRLGLQRVVVVSDYDSIRQVCSRDEFSGRPHGFLFRLRSYGKRLGVVIVDGPNWEKQRKFCVKYLREVGLGRDRMEQLILNETNEVINAIKEKMKVHGLVHMTNFFDVTLLNILWTMVAGRRYHIEDQKLVYLTNLIHDFTKIIDSSGGIINQFPIVRYLAPEKSGYRKLMHILDQERAFLKKSVEEHRKILSSGVHEINDLMGAYIQKIDSNNNISKSSTESSAFTDEQLLVILSDLFGAGSEPTLTTLNFTIIYLINFPEYQERARQQVFSVTGFNRELTLKDRASLCYVEAFISEVQRHANSVPLGVAHRAMQDSNLSGFSIPKDTVVMINTYSLHMDRAYWKDPEVFRPERFLNDSGQLIIPERFLPFGNGPRRCIGEPLAKASLLLFVASILNNFTISSPPGETPPPLTGVDGFILKVPPFKAVFTQNQ